MDETLQPLRRRAQRRADDVGNYTPLVKTIGVGLAIT